MQLQIRNSISLLMLDTIQNCVSKFFLLYKFCCSVRHLNQKLQKKGWTVTLAGTYGDNNIIPDVQMHLSFPKRSSSNSQKLDKSTYLQESIDQPKETDDVELDTNSNYNDTNSQKSEIKQAILPPSTPQSIKLNPKRSLTKNYFNTGIYYVVPKYFC